MSSCLTYINQVIVITGGSDGMGRAVAMNLAGRGAHVVVVARTVSKLQSTVEDMRVSGIVFFSCYSIPL